MGSKLLLSLAFAGSLVSFQACAAKAQDDPPPPRTDSQSADDARRDDDARRRDDADRDRRVDRSDVRHADERRSDGPEEGDRITLPADSVISVRIADEINSGKNHTGDLFTGIVDPSVTIHDRVVIPRGTEAHVRLEHNKKGGHVKGKAEVSLDLVSLVVNGRKLEVESDPEKKDQGALAAKGKAEAKSGHVGSATGVAGPAGAAAEPVIAAFSAAKVEIKPNSRVEFILSEPFSFRRPPVNGDTQNQ
jgi:hypothetical protein